MRQSTTAEGINEVGAGGTGEFDPDLEACRRESRPELGERRLVAGERRSRERERRRRDPGLEDRRPRVREGERERIFFGIFQKKKAKRKNIEKISKKF